MEVKLNLTYELAEPLVIEMLKEQYEILLKTAPLGFEEEEMDLSEAYKLVLQDFMGHKEFQKYAHDLAKKKTKKYDSSRFVSGL
jgi:uncharacterized phage-like protein YoqJ